MGSVKRISYRGLFLSSALGAAIVMIALWAPSMALAAGTGGIKGAITGPGSVPIAEVWACAYLTEGEEFEESCDFTGSSGTYSIPDLKAGKYIVEFWPESTEPSYVGEYYDDKPFWEEADEVEVKEGLVTAGIDAELAEGATIEGEVRAASVSGAVDALVCAQIPSGRPEGCAITDLDGTYSLPGLPAGEYKIQFIPAFPTHNLLNQFYDHQSAWEDANVLTIAAGETKTGIDADMEPGAEIRGTVYSAATGAPVAGVPVCALFKDEGEEEWLLRECLPTSSTGSYALIQLFTGTYKVVFSPEIGKDIFGEEFEDERDGYLKQYFNQKTTLAAADPLSLTAPEVRTGIDAHLQPEAFPLPKLATPILGKAIRPLRHRFKARKHCRPGFRKKKVAGKRRCVKVHKHRHHHRH
jgi:hypothetical protein